MSKSLTRIVQAPLQETVSEILTATAAVLSGGLLFAAIALAF